MEDIVRMNVTDRRVYWHTDTKKNTERLCRAGCHRSTDGHVMVGNSAHEYDRLGGHVPTYTLTKDRQVVWDTSVTD